MDRRHFLKQTLLGAGLLSVAPAAALQNWKRSAPLTASPVQPSDAHPDTPKGKKHSATSLRKSIMWGVIGMNGSSVLEKCRAVKAAGFEAIEPYSHQDREEFLAAMRDTGLLASSVCGAKHWDYPLSSPDRNVRHKGIDALYRTLEDAQAYGTDTVLLVPGIVNAETCYESCWNRSSKALREVLPSAEKAGIRIGIENVWNQFLLAPPEMVRYIDQFASSAVGAYFDVGNVAAFGWAEQWIDSLEGRIVRLHMKDFSRTKSNEQGRAKGFDIPLGEGENNWPRILEAIRRNYPYQWFTIEHQGGETPEGLSELSERWDRIVRS